MSENGDGADREQRHKRQSAESYASLGRYVQSFEHMVDGFRRVSLEMIVDHSGLVNVAFQHHSMSAQALFDIMRAIIATKIKRMDDLFPEHDRVITLALLQNLGKRVGSAVKVRNQLLHGTWYIGYASAEQDDFSEFLVHKSLVTKEGLTIAPAPSTVKEMDELSSENFNIQSLVCKLSGSITAPGGPYVSQNIFHSNGVWSVRMPLHTYSAAPPS